jgi:hypothetical protein
MSYCKESLQLQGSLLAIAGQILGGGEENLLHKRLRSGYYRDILLQSMYGERIKQGKDFQRTSLSLYYHSSRFIQYFRLFSHWVLIKCIWHGRVGGYLK